MQRQCLSRERIREYRERKLAALEELRSRDLKDIYQKHGDGLLPNIAGLVLIMDQPYESNLTLDFETLRLFLFRGISAPGFKHPIRRQMDIINMPNSIRKPVASVSELVHI